MKPELQLGCSAVVNDTFEKIKQKVVNDSWPAESVLRYLLKEYVTEMESVVTTLTAEELGDLKLGRQLLGLLDPENHFHLLQIKTGYPATLFQDRNKARSPLNYFMLHLQRRSHLLRADGWLIGLLTAFFSIYDDYRNLMNERLLTLIPVIPYWQRHLEPACIELTQRIVNLDTGEDENLHITNRLLLLRDTLPTNLRCRIAEKVANNWIKALNKEEEWYFQPWQFGFVFAWLSPATRQKVVEIAANTETYENAKVTAASLVKWLTEAEQLKLRHRLQTDVRHMTRHYTFESMEPVVNALQSLIDKSLIPSFDPVQMLSWEAIVTLIQSPTDLPAEQREKVVALVIANLPQLVTRFRSSIMDKLGQLKPLFDQANQKLDMSTHFETANATLRQVIHGINDEHLYILQGIAKLKDMLLPDNIPLMINALIQNIQLHDRPALIALLQTSVNFLLDWGPNLSDILRETIYNVLLEFVKTNDELENNYRNVIKLTILNTIFHWSCCSSDDRKVITTLIVPRFQAYLMQTHFIPSGKQLESMIRLNPAMLPLLISKAREHYDLNYCSALDRLSDLFTRPEQQSFIEPLTHQYEFYVKSWLILRKWMTANQRRQIADGKVEEILQADVKEYAQNPYLHMSNIIYQPSILDDASPALKLKVMFMMAEHSTDSLTSYAGHQQLEFFYLLQQRHEISGAQACLRALAINRQRHLLNDHASRITPMPETHSFYTRTLL